MLIRLSSGDPDELAEFPHERPRYIGLGWTMVMTAALAMTGMAVLLTQITTLSIPLRLLAATGWGLFVLAIDYLVVGFVDRTGILADNLAAPGEQRRRVRSSTIVRTGVRVVFAIIVGLAVGESLVIGVFGSAADDYLDGRAADRTKAELCLVDTTLSNYRPEVVPEPDCAQQLAKAGIQIEAQSTTGVTTTTTVAPSSGTQAQVDADYGRLTTLDQQIKFQSDRAQCELYPENFSADQVAALGCSGRAGNGAAHQAALAQRDDLQSEKNAILTRLDALAKTNADAAAAITRAQADATAKKTQVELDKRDSQQAKDAAARKSQLEERLKHIQAPGPDRAYGLSERFEATEHSVSPWIRWGLRMLFVIADMAPVLMKLTMGPSAIDVHNTLAWYEQRHPQRMRAARLESEWEEVRGFGRGRPRTPPPPPPPGGNGSRSRNGHGDNSSSEREPEPGRIL